MTTTSPQPHPLATLPREDLELIAQFVLCSGSLKDLAKHFGVSYPTIRTRVDSVIERLRSVLAGRQLDPLHTLLTQLVQRGELTISAAQLVRETLHRQRAADVSDTPATPTTVPLPHPSHAPLGVRP